MGGEQMNWFYWILEFVGRLAWPTAAVLIALMFRAPLIVALKRMRGLKYGGVEASFFEAEIESAKAQVAAVDADFDSGRVPDDPDLLEIANQFPVFAVVECWKRIEHSMLGAMRRLNIEIDSRSSVLKNIRYLSDMGAITPDMADTIRRMVNLRNLAAHKLDSGISKTDAYEYVGLTSYLTKYLDRVGEHNG